MKLYELEGKLDNLLIGENKFKDGCPNGLIVDAEGDNRADIERVVTGVSLRDELIDAAIERGAKAIVVHHPNGWWFSDTDKRVVGHHGIYMRRLIQEGISLFGYHLPLDMHPDIGNNALLCEKLFGTKLLAPFHSSGGCGGIVRGNVSAERLDEVFPKGWRGYNFEAKQYWYTVGICTGAGTGCLQEAVDRDCNLFITGEVREYTPIFAADHDISVIAAGHHRTETYGVSALADWLDRMENISAEFIDIDNPE